MMTTVHQGLSNPPQIKPECVYFKWAKPSHFIYGKSSPVHVLEQASEPSPKVGPP